MCLAIYKPADAKVSEKHLRNGFTNHSDGAGFAWAVDGKLHVKKGIFNVDDVLAQYELVKDYPCLIHFRKATHGKVDETNCHPFLLNDDKFALIHNGILPIKCSMEGLSDTVHFVRLVLEPMLKKHKVPISDGALNYLITTSIGTDKIVIMDEVGMTYIFNEEKGKWEDNVWYSNTSYSYGPYKATTYTPPATNTYGSSRSSSYFTRGGTSSTPSYESHKNWKKRWEEDAEGDASYLEFWRKAVTETKTDLGICGGCENPNKKTQVISGLAAGLDAAFKELGLTETVDDAGNVSVIDVEEVPAKKKEEEKGAGHMMEYGWWDEEIENDVAMLQLNSGINREQALLRVFNGRK